MYEPNKPYQGENFFQSLTNYLTNARNTIIGGDFNFVENLNDRSGGSICNTHPVGSQALSKLIQNQNLQDTWRKMNPRKSRFTHCQIQSDILSRLDRIYATKNINIF